MSDIFQEVDEEVRREQLKKLWERYGVYVIALAVVIVLAVAGWRGYEWWAAKQAAEAGAAFEAAINLSDEGKHEEAEKAFAKVAEEGRSGYRILGPLRAAAELARRDPAAAVKAYDELAADSSLGPVWQDFAALRAGYLLVDSAPYEEIRRRLEPAAAGGRAFRNSARELLALSAWRGGNAAAARNWAEMVLTDAEAPGGARNRVAILLALLGSEGKS